MKISTGKYTSESLLDLLSSNLKESQFFSSYLDWKGLIEDTLGVNFLNTSKEIKDYVIFEDENNDLWLKTIDNHIFIVTEFKKTILLPITLLTNGKIIISLSDINNLKLHSLLKADKNNKIIVVKKEILNIILNRDNFIVDISTKNILSFNELQEKIHY